MASPPSQAQILRYLRDFKIAQLVGVCLQFLLYGIYACLFCVSLVIMYQRRRTSGSTFTSKVFLAATSAIFLLATLDASLNFYRVVKAYVISPDPWVYLIDNSHWANFIHSLNVILVTLIGDSLVIYRCFIVWQRNWYAITLPMLLMATQIGVSIPIFIAYVKHDFLPFPTFARLLACVYPLVFAQNTITTGLISFRIWRRHRLSKAAGIRNMGSSLLHIARIIIESAALYTMQLLLLIILGWVGSNGTWILNYTTLPTIGIVFSLIAVRVHLSQLSVRMEPPTGVLPTFAHWTSTPLTDEFDSIPTDTEAKSSGPPTLPSVHLKSQGSAPSGVGSEQISVRNFPEP